MPESKAIKNLNKLIACFDAILDADNPQEKYNTSFEKVCGYMLQVYEDISDKKITKEEVDEHLTQAKEKKNNDKYDYVMLFKNLYTDYQNISTIPKTQNRHNTTKRLVLWGLAMAMLLSTCTSKFIKNKNDTVEPREKIEQNEQKAITAQKLKILNLH